MAIDWNALLSYNTVKIVSIRDYRLGVLHYLFLFAIVCYIIFYTLLFEKKYLLTETPTGSFRISLQQPPEPRPLSELPYCLQTQAYYKGFANYQCLYYDENLVVWPETEESAMLAATRISQTTFRADCNFTTPSCGYQNITDEAYTYVADLERFTLMIDHAFYATNIDLQRNSQVLSGKLLDKDGNEMVLEPPNQLGQPGELDIVELQTLLDAAQVTSLDDLSEVDNTRLDEARTMRYTGIILLVVIEYKNDYTFNTSDIRYTMTARQVANSQFKALQQIYTEFPNEFIEWNRHGIRLLFQRTGQVGKFDFQTMLINIIAGAALVSLCTIAVDIIAVYILPQKKYYGNFKYEPTPEPDEIKEMEKGKSNGYQTNGETKPLLAPASEDGKTYPESD